MSLHLSPWSVLSPVIQERVPFAMPTPVQQAAIQQIILKNKDVVAEAVTGSGKTLAFLLPLMHLVLKESKNSKSGDVLAVVVSPTRELAGQTFVILEELGSGLFRSASLIGGTDVAKDLAAIRSLSPAVIVATPGRLNEFLKEGHLTVRNCRFLVFDEADRLLDMGFSATLASVMSFMPKQRRTALFSATMTDAMEDLIKMGMRDPVHIRVGGDGTAERIPQSLTCQYQVIPRSNYKLSALLRILSESREKTIVYFATCACVDFFAKVLEGLSLRPIIALHGRMDPKKRTALYQRFLESSSAEGPVLLCTDVAARGLDFPDITLVVQMDAPQDPKNFVHRCGRTARNGASGRALLFLLPCEMPFVDLMRLRSVTLHEATIGGELMSYGRWIREQCLKDRALMTASIVAFVSFIRSYAEHHASLIFRLKSLKLEELYDAFGLLRVPKMPELSKYFSLPKHSQKDSAEGHNEAFLGETKLHWNALYGLWEVDRGVASTVPFADAKRERQRLDALSKADTVTKDKPRKKKRPAEAWSDQKAKKVKREKNQARKAFLKKAKVQAARKSDEESDGISEADWKEWKAERKKQRA